MGRMDEVVDICDFQEYIGQTEEENALDILKEFNMLIKSCEKAL